MATLTEAPEWTAGIYQLEEEDVVLGGPNGIDNLQAKQLADRTLYLKQLLEGSLAFSQPLDATLTAIAALAIQADRIIYSTGDDTFALTMLTAYARTLLACAGAAEALETLGAAPLDSAALTGIPTAPTPQQTDRTTRLATTEYVHVSFESKLPPARLYYMANF